jgi:hypothetical protein
MITIRRRQKVMTQQIADGADMMPPSLRVKLQRLAGELTEEEQAHVRAMVAEDVTGALTPSLRATLERCAAELTTDEQAHLAELVGVAMFAGDGTDTDTAGHRAASYEDEDGWKGKPGTSPWNKAEGGVPLPNLGAVLIAGFGVVWGGVISTQPEPPE